MYKRQVLIVAYKKNARGERLDLSNFRDPSKYLKVSKDEFGQTIHYRELPGLWNGGMHDWNTLFVEVPGDSFTPVKSALDLLKEGHQP